MPETHSPRVLLRGEAGLGARRPSVPRPQPCPLSQLGRSAPRPRRTDGPKQSSGSCILQRETLLGQQTTAPTRLGSRKQCRPFSPPGPRSPYGQAGLGCPGSLGPAALLGISGARNPLPTGSPSWGSRIGRAKAFCAQAPAKPPESAQQLSAKVPSHRCPKRASDSCILQRETLLRQQTTTPTRHGSRKQRKPFSPPAHTTP